jgi:FSR family fosmidomycin resistance protein-like MFS transporter
MRRFPVQLALYAMAHFLVDLGCAYLIFSLPRDGDWAMVLLLYNFFAFAGQMPLGLLADRLDRNGLLAALGAALVAAAYGLTGLPLGCAVAAGIGNGLFHVGGGVDVLNGSTEKSGALGVFVSPGAFGIFLGAKAAGSGLGPLLVAALLCFAALLALAARTPERGFRSGNAPLDLSLGQSGWALVLCLFLVVWLRSYVGMVQTFAWKTGPWAVAAVAAVVLGKTAGGFLADRFGVTRTAAGSLALAAGLFLFSAWAIPGVLAIFLFNMTMPMTLWAVARLLPGAKGFSFGLLTFALFLGFVPVWMGLPALLTGGWGYALGALASLGLLVLGLKGERNHG